MPAKCCNRASNENPVRAPVRTEEPKFEEAPRSHEQHASYEEKAEVSWHTTFQVGVPEAFPEQAESRESEQCPSQTETDQHFKVGIEEMVEPRLSCFPALIWRAVKPQLPKTTLRDQVFA
jgi:hypothetical protein